MDAAGLARFAKRLHQGGNKRNWSTLHGYDWLTTKGTLKTRNLPNFTAAFLEEVCEKLRLPDAPWEDDVEIDRGSSAAAATDRQPDAAEATSEEEAVNPDDEAAEATQDDAAAADAAAAEATRDDDVAPDDEAAQDDDDDADTAAPAVSPFEQVQNAFNAMPEANRCLFVKNHPEEFGHNRLLKIARRSADHIARLLRNIAECTAQRVRLVRAPGSAPIAALEAGDYSDEDDTPPVEGPAATKSAINVNTFDKVWTNRTTANPSQLTKQSADQHMPATHNVKKGKSNQAKSEEMTRNTLNPTLTSLQGRAAPTMAGSTVSGRGANSTVTVKEAAQPQFAGTVAMIAHEPGSIAKAVHEDKLTQQQIVLSALNSNAQLNGSGVVMKAWPIPYGALHGLTADRNSDELTDISVMNIGRMFGTYTEPARLEKVKPENMRQVMREADTKVFGKVEHDYDVFPVPACCLPYAGKGKGGMAHVRVSVVIVAQQFLALLMVPTGSTPNPYYFLVMLNATDVQQYATVQGDAIVWQLRRVRRHLSNMMSEFIMTCPADEKKIHTIDPNCTPTSYHQFKFLPLVNFMYFYIPKDGVGAMQFMATAQKENQVHGSALYELGLRQMLLVLNCKDPESERLGSDVTLNALLCDSPVINTLFQQIRGFIKNLANNLIMYLNNPDECPFSFANSLGDANTEALVESFQAITTGVCEAFLKEDGGAVFATLVKFVRARRDKEAYNAAERKQEAATALAAVQAEVTTIKRDAADKAKQHAALMSSLALMTAALQKNVPDNTQVADAAALVGTLAQSAQVDLQEAEAEAAQPMEH